MRNSFVVNSFYSEWDEECLGSGYQRPGAEDYRTPFQIDRDRILYTSAFRRLQSKTQVFVSREYDFYRTRLTHSLEVAQIGRSICQRLEKTTSDFSPDFHPDPDLVEGVCLAHDLGHPPFGHAGERTLHRLMRDWGGFEGNAQSLRLVSEIIYEDAGKELRRGINPTRAYLDGILKYKTLLHETPGASNHYIYDEQAPLLEFVHDDVLSELHRFEPGKARNSCHSLECQIMDWADDTAYSLNDIVDSVDAGFLTMEKINRWAENRDLDDDEAQWTDALLRSIQEQRVEATLGRKIGHFIQGCRVESDHNRMGLRTARYRFQLAVDPGCLKEARLYKRLALDEVFRSPRLQQLDFKSDRVLGEILAVMLERYIEKQGRGPALQILPSTTAAILAKAECDSDRARIICDYVAGMTDSYAIRTYRRLFDPEFGSIVDLIR